MMEVQAASATRPARSGAKSRENTSGSNKSAKLPALTKVRCFCWIPVGYILCSYALAHSLHEQALHFVFFVFYNTLLVRAHCI